MYIDIIYMLLNERKHYLIAARYNLIEWIKARALIKAINKNVVKFIEEKFICCYNKYKILIMNRGSKNKLLVSNLIRKFGIKRKIIFIYYFQINKLVERNY